MNTYLWFCQQHAVGFSLAGVFFLSLLKINLVFKQKLALAKRQVFNY